MLQTLQKQYLALCLMLLLMLVSVSSFADVPADVSAAISTGVTDVGTIGAAILGVVIAIVGFNWLRRVIK